MAVKRIAKEEGSAKTRKPSAQSEPERRLEPPQGEVSRVLDLQRLVGNRAVQRLLAQRESREALVERIANPPVFKLDPVNVSLDGGEVTAGGVTIPVEDGYFHGSLWGEEP